MSLNYYNFPFEFGMVNNMPDSRNVKGDMLSWRAVRIRSRCAAPDVVSDFPFHFNWRKENGSQAKTS